MFEKLQLILKIAVFIFFIGIAFQALKTLHWERWIRKDGQKGFAVLLVLLALVLGSLAAQAMLTMIEWLRQIILM